MDIEKNIAQMRKGVLELCILSIVSRKDAYASDIIGKLKESQLIVVEGTLYPLLRRLEKQGLLDSEWSLETSRPRRYYVLNVSGREALETLKGEWNALAAVLGRLL